MTRLRRPLAQEAMGTRGGGEPVGQAAHGPGPSVHVAVSMRTGRAVPVIVDLGWRQGHLSIPTPPQAIFL